MAVRCANCSQDVAVAAGERLPPWCPQCGADLSTRGAGKENALDSDDIQPKPQSHGGRLTWREPAADAGDASSSSQGPGEEESLADTIERVARSGEVKKEQTWRNRRAGMGACL